MSNVRSASTTHAIAAALCMLLSGFAALVYQIVWTHQMSVAIGTAQSAVAIMLASFLGGLALGGWCATRWLGSVRDAGRSYALLEVLIAAWALFIPFLFPTLQKLLVGLLAAGEALPPDAGWSQLGVYLALVAIAFLPPTVAMGATLPILVRAVRGEARDVAGLYAANTLGAAAGAALAGFVLAPALGLSGASQLAAAANLAAAWIAWAHLRGGHTSLVARDDVPPEPGQGGLARSAMIAAFLAGTATFALEVFWTRLLAIPFGASTQGFAFMLCLWLSGLALGGAIAARRRGSAAAALAAGAALSVLGYFGIVLTGAAEKTAVLAMLPSAIAFGMAFPRLVSAAAGDPARSAALVYAANTTGAVAGSMLAGHLLLEALGFGGAMLVAVGLLLAAAAMASSQALSRWGLYGAAAVAVSWIFVGVQQPQALLKSGVVDRDTSGDLVSLKVGRVATVEARQRDDGIAIRSDGLPEALVPRIGAPPVLNDQHWLTALPALARPEARSMMVIGLGGGVSLESIPVWIKTIDVVEIEERIIEVNRKIAPEREVDPLLDPRIALVHNDARNAMLRTSKRYDIIVSQPSHPWTAGSANLYTKEFVALARTRLSDDGVFVQWMNASFVQPRLLGSFLATLTSEFRHVRVYEPVPFNFIVVASQGPIAPEAGFDEAVATGMRQMQRAGILSEEDFSWSLLMDEASVRRLTAGLRPISDDRNFMAFETGPGRGILSREDLDAFTGRSAASRGGAAYRDLRLAQAGLAPFAVSADDDLVALARQAGAAGDFQALEALDAQLASLAVTDRGYARANQFRVAWRLERLAGAAPGDQQGLAGEALSIVDAALRVETTTDLLMQRAVLAQLLDQRAMLIETALTFAQVAKQSRPANELDVRRAQALAAAVGRLPSSILRTRAIRALATIN